MDHVAEQIVEERFVQTRPDLNVVDLCDLFYNLNCYRYYGNDFVNGWKNRRSSSTSHETSLLHEIIKIEPQSVYFVANVLPNLIR